LQETDSGLARSLRQPFSINRQRASARRGHSSRYKAELYALLAPYLGGTALLVVLPALLSFALAFTEFDALSPPVWRGLRNFQTLWHDRLFWIAVRNSLYFVVLAVPLRVLGALALALLLNQRRRGVGIYRVAVYLPTIIPDVAYALIWLWIFNPIYGPLNMILGSLGLPTPAWLVQANTAKLAIVIMSLFQIGEGFVVLLAGRQDVPEEYYQAAAVDGGTRWQQFRYITLPLLAPWLMLLTIRDIILSAQSTFTPALIMTGGGPYYATLFMPLLIYEEAFDRFRFGLGSALMLLLFLGVGLLLLLVRFVVQGWGYDDDI
jgi:multiple sugar transport system permease protein